MRTDWPLVMVGDNRYDSGYLERLKSQADERVRFTGAIYGVGYWALQKNAGIFVFACEVGGVHPALIEAMAAENAVLYLDSPENDETAGDAAIRYTKSPDDLAVKLQRLLEDPQERNLWAERAAERAQPAVSLGCSSQSSTSNCSKTCCENAEVVFASAYSRLAQAHRHLRHAPVAPNGHFPRNALRPSAHRMRP